MTDTWQNRIVGTRDMSPSDLVPNPKNWRKHPTAQQKALEGVLDEVGWVQNVIWNQRTGHLVDGHLRVEMALKNKEPSVPVNIVDLSEEEEDLILATIDPIAAMAEADREKIMALTERVKTENAAIASMLHDLKKATDPEYWKNRIRSQDEYTVEMIDDPDRAMAVDEIGQETFAGAEHIAVKFSGGRDSTMALLWAKHNFPDLHIVAVFSNPGYEFPGMTIHVQKVCDYLGVECVIVHPERDMLVDFYTSGFPSAQFLSCREKYIYSPVNAYIRNLPPETTVVLDGSRGDQKLAISRKTKTSAPNDSKMKGYRYYHPCHDIDYETELRILAESGVPIWSGYDKGFVRTSCWCCPGMNSRQAYAIEQNFPWAIEIIREIEAARDQKLNWAADRGIDHLLAAGRKKAAATE